MSTNRITQYGKALDDIANGAVDPFEVLSRDDIRVLVRHFLEGMRQAPEMPHVSAAASAPAPEPVAVQPAGEPAWATWSGNDNGALPLGLDNDDAIAYRMADSLVLHTDYPFDLNWIHERALADIVAYRMLTADEVKDMTPWTAWTGGDCPVDPGAMVQVRLVNWGINEPINAGEQNWQHWPKAHHNYDCNIVAYRVIGAPKPALKAVTDAVYPAPAVALVMATRPEQPATADWVKWVDRDGYGAMPVAVDDVIAYRMRDGNVLCTDYPSQLEWCQSGKRSDIVEYRLLTIEESKEMAPWVEWVGGECPIDPAAVVQIRMHENGRNDAGLAGLERWKHWPSNHADYDANIVAYRLVTA